MHPHIHPNSPPTKLITNPHHHVTTLIPIPRNINLTRLASSWQDELEKIPIPQTVPMGWQLSLANLASLASLFSKNKKRQ